MRDQIKDIQFVYLVLSSTLVLQTTIRDFSFIISLYLWNHKKKEEKKKGTSRNMTVSNFQVLKFSNFSRLKDIELLKLCSRMFRDK